MTVEPTAFLYPFIDRTERDAGGLLIDMASSAAAKMADSSSLRVAMLERYADVLASAGVALADRFRLGGRLFTFGNGGSATDALATADLFRDALHGRPLSATSLVADVAVLTALANDVGFDLVFSRQIIAHARQHDIAIGFSTSGDSLNVLRALEEAHRRQMLTIGLCGYGGGAMWASNCLDHCLVVQSDSVHRIQEAQAALVFALWSNVQSALRERSLP